MPYLEVRMWERHTQRLWDDGEPVQELSFIRFSENREFCYLVFVTQADPQGVATVWATRYPRHRPLDERKVQLFEAINRKELREVLGLYRLLPGTPRSVRFCTNEGQLLDADAA